jgi:hypothetical protein
MQRVGRDMTADACDAAPLRSADVIYQSAASGSSCWSRNHLGYRRELPMVRWIVGLATTPQNRLADEHMLRHCSSRPTLGLGCGPRAIHRVALLPAGGSWEQVLLTDGNIGIACNPVQTLRRAADLLTHGGIVVIEIDSPANMSCYEWLHWETEHYLGHWFPWSRVGAGALGDIARAAGFCVPHVINIHNRVIAVLIAAAHGGVKR